MSADIAGQGIKIMLSDVPLFRNEPSRNICFVTHKRQTHVQCKSEMSLTPDGMTI